MVSQSCGFPGENLCLTWGLRIGMLEGIFARIKADDFAWKSGIKNEIMDLMTRMIAGDYWSKEVEFVWRAGCRIISNNTR